MAGVVKKSTGALVTAGALSLALAGPAFAAPVSLGSASAPDVSGIVDSATANAASLVGSA